MKHEWESIVITYKNGEKPGKRCKKCGVKKYPWHGMIRWKYPDGRVHDNKSVDIIWTTQTA